MAYKRVDLDDVANIEGYSFIDEIGEEFTASKLDSANAIDIGYANEYKFSLRIKEIPTFIKMLQATLDHGK